MSVASSALPVVEPERIVVSSPDLVPGLSGKGLQVDYEVDGVKFAGAEKGARQPGELIVDWYADSGLFFHQEVWKTASPIEAWWKYHAENPRPEFERDFDELVVSVKPAEAVNADSYSYFCGNSGRSSSGDLEDCQVWGYWARYGQYLVYVELRGARYPKSSMDPVVSYFDARFRDL